MFNTKKQLEEKISNLENRIFKTQKSKTIEERMYDFWSFSTFYTVQTLEDRIEALEETQRRFKLLLKHLDIEYVEIIEKNGIQTKTEKFRKIKKSSKKKEVELD